MSNTTFIVGRRTPRTFVLEPASRVGPSDKKGCFSLTRLRRSEETLEHHQVMGALGATMRDHPRERLTTKDLYDAACAGPYGHLMAPASYAGPTSSGVPARIIVKGQ
jgi:hypothetical protein